MISNAQAQIQVNNGQINRFQNCEVLEVTINQEAITLRLAEFETLVDDPERDGQEGRKGLFLNVTLTFQNGYTFPIKPSDSVIITTSTIQQNLGEYHMVNAKSKSMDTNKGKAVAAKKKSKEEQIKELSKRAAAGDMAALDELQKLGEGLMNDAMPAVDEMSSADDMKEAPTYYEIYYTDANLNEESQGFSGQVYLQHLDKNKVVLEFSGEFITNCLSRRATCEKQPSKLIPNTKVLREGKISGTVNTTIKTFEDFR
ncbi:MAG: hypothetical protein ACPGJS_16150 [Flammeovirgaceae bacterium]